jgi:hypothetical protein
MQDRDLQELHTDLKDIYSAVVGLGVELEAQTVLVCVLLRRLAKEL